jgi:hypothetical protein
VPLPSFGVDTPLRIRSAMPNPATLVGRIFEIVGEKLLAAAQLWVFGMGVGGTLQSTTKSQLVTSDSGRGYDVMRGRVIPFKQAKDREPLAKQNDLRTGCSAPESGIYSVTHSQHRLPREITLIREQSFPRCCKCSDPVYFTLVRPARSLDVNPHGFRMTLYELPELAEQQDESIAG